MKKTFFVFVLLLFLQVIIFADTYPVVVAGNWNILYENPDPRYEEANDFHLCGIIESIDNFMPELEYHDSYVIGGGVPWYLEEYTMEKVANHPTHWYFTAHFKTDGFILPGTVMHFGLYFITNYCNVAVINCAYWTYYKMAVGRMPIISFRIEHSIVNLINTAEIPMVLRDVELGVTREPVPLKDMVTTGLGNPGEGGNGQYEIKWIKMPDRLADILARGIKPGATVSFHVEELISRNLEPGEILLIRGYTVYQGKLLPWWIQHQEAK